MPDHLLALDVGTTTVRAVVFDRTLQPVAIESREPRAGIRRRDVEIDPERLWQAVLETGRAALAALPGGSGEIAAIGLASQRASLVIWQADGGTALAPIVGWQDLRGVQRAAALAEAGFLVPAITPAAKVESVLDAIPGSRDALADGRVRIGNVDAWIADRLASGGGHVTDVTQALALGWFDPFGGGWNAALLDRQGIPAQALPRLVPKSSAELSMCAAEWFGRNLPLCAIVGDQQAASVAEGLAAPGDARVTLGTSACLEVHSGPLPALVPGCFPMCLPVRAGESGPQQWVVEGLVNTAGAWFDWLAPRLGAADAAGLMALAEREPDAGGAFALPALQGLGAPHQRADVAAHIGGLGSATSREAIARAGIEAVAFRLREILGAVHDATDLPRVAVLCANGGASRGDVLLQSIADVTGLEVERNAVREATSLGAAMLAGEAVGWFSADGARALRRSDAVFRSEWSRDRRDAAFAAWHARCAPLLAAERDRPGAGGPGTRE